MNFFKGIVFIGAFCLYACN